MFKTVLVLMTFVASGWSADAEARHKAKYGRPYPATEKRVEEARRAAKQQQENAKKQQKQDKQERERSNVENN